MLVNFDFKFTGLDGQPVPDDNTIAQILGRVLADSLDGIEPVKAYDWAQLFFKNGECEMDKADVTMLDAAILRTNKFSNLGKGQIHEVLSGLLLAKPLAKPLAKVVSDE